MPKPILKGTFRLSPQRRPENDEVAKLELTGFNSLEAFSRHYQKLTPLLALQRKIPLIDSARMGLQ